MAGRNCSSVCQVTEENIMPMWRAGTVMPAAKRVRGMCEPMDAGACGGRPARGAVCAFSVFDDMSAIARRFPLPAVHREPSHTSHTS